MQELTEAAPQRRLEDSFGPIPRFDARQDTNHIRVVLYESHILKWLPSKPEVQARVFALSGTRKEVAEQLRQLAAGIEMPDLREASTLDKAGGADVDDGGVWI